MDGIALVIALTGAVWLAGAAVIKAADYIELRRTAPLGDLRARRASNGRLTGR